MNPHGTELMDMHVRVNIGTYFDGVDISPGGEVAFAYSRRISDFYWNYSFLKSGSGWDDAAIREAADLASARDRPLALWKSDSDPVPPSWSVASMESWMTAAPNMTLNTPSELDITRHEIPDSSMLAVFVDAYSSEHQEGDPGYFALPAEYGEAYASGRPQQGVTAVHLAGRVAGRCVSVASLYLHGSVAGLYSVATMHSQRAKGYGSAISRAAMNVAAESGVREVFLQTESDSVVESMYSSIGFKRQFVGALMTRQDDGAAT